MNLPPFPELMASLQLAANGNPAEDTKDQSGAAQISSTPSSPSSSSSSSSSSPDTPCHLIRNSPIVASQPRLSRAGEHKWQSKFKQPAGVSPYIQRPLNVLFMDGAPGKTISSPGFHDVCDFEAESEIPISLYARRQAPQSISVTCVFPGQKSPYPRISYSPVILPSLLPCLTTSYTAGDSCDMDDVSSESRDLPEYHAKRKGLRLSSHPDPDVPAFLLSPHSTAYDGS